VDCSNGAAFSIAPLILNELGGQVLVIHDQPDGININYHCGSTHMEFLKQFVIKNSCDIGVAFDGDADRMLAVDEKGEIIDGDRIMAICGSFMKSCGKLKDDTIVATVMSNLGFDVFAKENGIKLLKTKVGDRYVLEEMIKEKFSLGGEQSGHVIFLEHNTTGDGILTALQLLSVVKKSGKKASELANMMNVYPQVLINAKVSNEKKNNYMKDSVIAQEIKNIESDFKDEGRVLIRPSGTEPLVRVMIEGKDKDYIEKRAKELADIIEQRLK
jgi:phosphoglucosamine mutase